MTAFLDARTGDLPERLDTEVCVIGAGAAGITLARELAARGRRVLLVESGGEKIEAQTQSLYVAPSSGMPYYDLASCRLRFFGGTTNHWTGHCYPFRPIDYEGRPELGLPAWPINHETLAPFLERTVELLEIDTQFFNAAGQLRDKGLDPSQLFENRSDALVTGNAQISRANLRFGPRFRQEIADSPHIQPIEYLNVTEIILNANGDVDHIKARTLDGKQTVIHARAFILCCHAIENARILLDSDRQMKGGIGNRYDHVGRYFMEHLYIMASRMIPSENFPDIYNREFLSRYSLSANPGMSEKVVRERGIMSGYYCRFNPVYWEEDARRAKARLPNRWMEPGTLALYHDLKTVMSDFSGIRTSLSRKITGSYQPVYYQLEQGIQQAPNPDSRITLDTKRNRLGQREVRLHWALSDLDLKTVNVGQEVIARELSALNMGRFELEEITMATMHERAMGHYHHIGTTRMSADPKDGVVDANMKVHDVGNLYIAGSSVFTTCGGGPPTMMLIAMSLRLAEHVADKMAKV